jgi:hypothetical protein
MLILVDGWDTRNGDPQESFASVYRNSSSSYTVSIPKEIVSFMEQQKKIMNEMVKLCFEDFRRLSLNFEDD